MFPPATRRDAGVFAAGLVVGLIVGLIVASAATGGVVFGSTTDGGSAPASSPDPESPPTSIGVGTGCLDTPADTGWVHEVATGRSRTLTANLSVAHDPDETVNATVERVAPGVYQLRVTVVAAERGEGGTPDCPTGSLVEAGVSLPTEYDRFEVVVDGRTVGTMPNDGDTTADLRTFAWHAGEPSAAWTSPLGQARRSS